MLISQQTETEKLVESRGSVISRPSHLIRVDAPVTNGTKKSSKLCGIRTTALKAI